MHDNLSGNDLLQSISDRLDELTESIKEKTVNQTVFVKKRHGIGYINNKINDDAEDEKARRELVEMNENLSTALATSRDRNQFLLEKIMVL